MKRLLLKFGIYILTGAIINVAVAWGGEFVEIQSTQPMHSYDLQSYELSPSEDWWVYRERTCVSDRVLSMLSQHTSCSLNPPALTVAEKKRPLPVLPWWWSKSRNIPAGAQKLIEEHANGWPMVSLAAHFGPDSNVSNQWSWVSQGDGITVQRRPPLIRTILQVDRVLPLRPIWSGFAINTVFYSAILGLLFAAPRTLRRRRRCKHGLCAACGYPIGQSNVCTECGSPVTPKRIEVRA